MDSLAFFVDFLNSDDQNMSSLDYPFVKNESGVYVIDLLNLKKSYSGATYDRLGCGFSAYNGNTDQADYVVVDNGDGTYAIEIKIMLSESVKNRLRTATHENRPKIGFGIVLQDDKNSNGVYEYDEGLDERQLVENVAINAVWHNLVMLPTKDGHLQPLTYDSPRWLSTLVLADGASLAKVESVKVTADKTVALQGETVSASAVVLGFDVSQNVVWSILNAKSADTSITDKGVLKIAANETAEKIVIVATAADDKTITGQFEISIESKTTESSDDSSSDPSQQPSDTSSTGKPDSITSGSTPATGGSSEQLIWIAIALAAAAVLAAGVIVVVQRKTYKE